MDCLIPYTDVELETRLCVHMSKNAGRSAGMAVGQLHPFCQ